jgi:hypothetical protein
VLSEAAGGATIVGDGDDGSKIGDGGCGSVGSGEGDMLAEAMEKRGKAGATAEGHDAQTSLTGVGGVMIGYWQRVFLGQIVAQCG